MRQLLQYSFAVFLSVLFVAQSTRLSSGNVTRLLRNNYAGPYKIKLEYACHCNHSEPMAVELFLKCGDRNETPDRNKARSELRRLEGNITVRRDLSDGRMQGICTLNQWRDREWKRDGVIMKFKNGIQASHDHLSDIHRSIFGEGVGFKKGVYKVDTPFKLNIKSIPVFPYGRWKGQVLAFESQPSKPDF